MDLQRAFDLINPSLRYLGKIGAGMVNDDSLGLRSPGQEKNANHKQNKGWDKFRRIIFHGSSPRFGSIFQKPLPGPFSSFVHPKAVIFKNQQCNRTTHLTLRDQDTKAGKRL